MKTALIVLLVILVVLLAVPLGIGMAMGACPECTLPGQAFALGICLVALSLSLLLLVPQLVWARLLPGSSSESLAVTARVERPPRSV